MSSRSARASRVVCVAGVLIVSLAGCGTSTVSRDDVAAGIKDQLEKQNVHADAVTCPTDLVAEVGRSVRCRFEVDGQPVDAIAEVSSVSGGTAQFDITTEARAIAGKLLAAKVSDQVARQNDLTIDSSTCAGDLAPTVGATQTCALVKAGQPIDVTVTVTKVDGGLIAYSIAQT